MTHDPSMPGFARGDVNLANWRVAPFSKWAFQNVQEIIPSAVFRADRAGETEDRVTLGRLARLPVAGTDGSETDLQGFLAETDTDSLVVMKGSQIAAEWHAPHCDPVSRTSYTRFRNP